MVNLQEFIESIKATINEPISESYKRQFKLKGEFVLPSHKLFNTVLQRFLEDDKLRTKRKWDNQCKQFFVWFLIKTCQSRITFQIYLNQQTPEEWEEFQQILDFDQNILKARWITLINPQSKSLNWNQNEDELIRNEMKSKNNKHIWTQISIKLYDLNDQQLVRTPKQIRERWMNYLNPHLKKSSWLLAEDLVILSSVVKIGKKWSQISSKLEGRTENQVKNRFKSIIHKICKDDDSEEIECIKGYIRKNQNADSLKMGLIGKRGRHKKHIKKFRISLPPQKSKIEEEIEDEDQSDNEDESKSSESISDAGQQSALSSKDESYHQKKERLRQRDVQKQLNMVLRSKEKIEHIDEKEEQICSPQVEKKIAKQYKKKQKIVQKQQQQQQQKEQIQVQQAIQPPPQMPAQPTVQMPNPFSNIEAQFDLRNNVMPPPAFLQFPNSAILQPQLQQPHLINPSN